jgi:excisionase family DNA binding protein
MSRRNKVVEIPKSKVAPRGFRIAEAAVYMGVSPWFVEQEIRAGRLRALKLCRRTWMMREIWSRERRCISFSTFESSPLGGRRTAEHRTLYVLSYVAVRRKWRIADKTLSVFVLTL